MQIRTLTLTLAATAAVLLAAGGPAHAAKLTIEYEIESGSADFSFSDPFAALSGSLRVTIPGTGPASAFVPGSGTATLLAFEASTASFRIVLDPAFGTGTSLGFVSIGPVGGYTATTVGNYPVIGGLLELLISGSSVSGTLTASTAYSGFGTLLFVGREVARSVVPEPQPPVLIGAMIVGLVGLAAWRRRA